MTYLLIAIPLLLVILMCLHESKKRKINFFVALLLCLLTTPLIGYFIVTNRPLRQTMGCKWCGNEKNEAEYCGLCGKNEIGAIFQK